MPKFCGNKNGRHSYLWDRRVRDRKQARHVGQRFGVDCSRKSECRVGWPNHYRYKMLLSRDYEYLSSYNRWCRKRSGLKTLVIEFLDDQTWFSSKPAAQMRPWSFQVNWIFSNVVIGSFSTLRMTDSRKKLYKCFYCFVSSINFFDEIDNESSWHLAFFYSQELVTKDLHLSQEVEYSCGRYFRNFKGGHW